MKPNSLANKYSIISREKTSSLVKPQRIKYSNPKLEAINQELLSKIDNIYFEYEKLIPEIKSTFDYKKEKQIQNNDNEKMENTSTKHSSNSNFLNTSTSSKNDKKLPKIKEKKIPLKVDQNIDNKEISDIEIKKKISNLKPNNTHNKKPKNKKNSNLTFMTGAGIIKTRKNKKEEIDSNKPNNIDDNILDNIDLSNFDPNSLNMDNISIEGSDDFKLKMQKDMKEFKELCDEIDEYKSELKEEFDEIKWLIQFADNTHSLIDRHKNIMGSIFRGSGLPINSLYDDNDDIQKYKDNKYRAKSKGRNYSPGQRKIKNALDIVNSIKDNYDYDNKTNINIDIDIKKIQNTFNKLQTINQIKNNIGNIQDSMLDYHDKFNKRLQRSQSEVIDKKEVSNSK